MKRMGFKFGKLMVTTVTQGSGAPFIDGAFTTDAEGLRYKGVAILLLPWKRNQYGESLPQLALVLGWFRP